MGKETINQEKQRGGYIVKVKLFDRTEIIVSKEVGLKLGKSLAKSTDGMVTINGYMLKKSAIAYIAPGGYTEADMPEQKVDSTKRLKSDNRTEAEQYKAARKAAAAVKDILNKHS